MAYLLEEMSHDIFNLHSSKFSAARAVFHPSPCCHRRLIPIMAQLPAPEKAALTAALARAGDACETGDPAQGTREAAGIMRLIGHIEARLGLAPPPITLQRLGGIAPAPRG
jgi:hypothetical protein